MNTRAFNHLPPCSSSPSCLPSSSSGLTYSACVSNDHNGQGSIYVNNSNSMNIMNNNNDNNNNKQQSASMPALSKHSPNSPTSSSSSRASIEFLEEIKVANTSNHQADSKESRKRKGIEVALQDINNNDSSPMVEATPAKRVADSTSKVPQNVFHPTSSVGMARDNPKQQLSLVQKFYVLQPQQDSNATTTSNVASNPGILLIPGHDKSLALLLSSNASISPTNVTTTTSATASSISATNEAGHRKPAFIRPLVRYLGSGTSSTNATLMPMQGKVQLVPLRNTRLVSRQCVYGSMTKPQPQPQPQQEHQQWSGKVELNGGRQAHMMHNLMGNNPTRPWHFQPHMKRQTQQLPQTSNANCSINVLQQQVLMLQPKPVLTTPAGSVAPMQASRVEGSSTKAVPSTRVTSNRNELRVSSSAVAKQSGSPRPMSSSNRLLLQHINMSFYTNLLPSLRECSKAEHVPLYMESVSTAESVESNWMLARFEKHRQSVVVFAREVRSRLLSEFVDSSGASTSTSSSSSTFRLQTENGNWLEVLVLRSAYYTTWNYARQIKNKQNNAKGEEMAQQEEEEASRREQQQQLSIEPSLDDFWLFPNELLPLRNPESRLNSLRREALLDLANTLRELEVDEMEITLLAAWLLFSHDESMGPCDSQDKRKANLARTRLYSIIHDLTGLFDASGKRARLLLASISSAVGFTGSMLSSS